MTDAQPTGALLVATPTAADPVNALSQDDAAHISLLWFGERTELGPEAEDAIRLHVQDVVAQHDEFDADVAGVAVLGSEQAGVLLIESHDLVFLRNDLYDNPYVQQAWLGTEQFPTWLPHLTLGYGTGVPSGDLPESIHFDAVGLWLAGQHESFGLQSPDVLVDPGDVGFGGSVIPPVLGVDDLPLCVQYAQEHPDARWYAEKRACALGMSQLIPARWAVPV